jgi:hypothetical protein
MANRVGRREPVRRRSPRIEEDLRAQTEVLIGRIKAMVGPVVVKTKLATREKRRGRGR